MVVFIHEALGKLDIQSVVGVMQFELVFAEAVLVLPLGVVQEAQGREGEEDDHHDGDCGPCRTADFVTLVTWISCRRVFNAVLGGGHIEGFCCIDQC